MGKIRISFLLLVFFLIFVIPARALTINEIYPAPNSDGLEWVELYNDTNDTIDLSGYSLTDPTGKHINFESTSISGNGFVIATSKNVLNNTGDTVSLKDKDGNTIESATYPNSLNEKKSYARCPDGTGNWIITETITKNGSNDSACQNQVPTATPIITSEPTQSIVATITPTSAVQTQSSYDGIYISEVMSYPKTGENEWVELYNDNNFIVTLTNWHIDDIENGGSAPKTFNLTIAAKNYSVVDISSAMFNNTGDTVRLLDQNNTLKDLIVYTEATSNVTIGKTILTSNYVCQQNPSKGEPNHDCIKEEVTPAITKSSTTASPIITNPKSAAVVLAPVTKKITSKSVANPQNNMHNTNSLFPTNSTQTEPNEGAVLGESNLAADQAIEHNNLLPIVKGLSGSAYLISLLATTLLIKKLFIKIRTNSI